MKLSLLPLAAFVTAAFAEPPPAVSSVLASLSSAGLLPSDGPPFATNPALWSSIRASLVSEGKIPSTVTAPPWATGSYGPGSGPWGPWGPKGPGGPGRHWGGPDGWGPWGTNAPPWSEWATNSAWRTNAPWTNWWGGSVCPPSEWPGWTAGPWSTNAPWTNWAGCTATTTATTIVTATDASGSVVANTQYGVQVAAAEGTQSGGNVAGGQGTTGAAVPAMTAAPVVAVGAAILGLAVGL